MKKTSLILLFSLIYLNFVYSQNSFKLIFGEKDINNIPGGIIEMNSDTYLAVYWNYAQVYKHQKNLQVSSSFVLFSAQGEILDIKKIENYKIHGIQKQDDNYFCYGYYQEDTTYQILTILLDEELNIIKENKYFLPFYSYSQLTGFISDCIYKIGHKYYCSFTLINSETNKNNSVGFIFSEEGDSLYSNLLPETTIFDIRIKPSNNNLLLYGYKQYYQCDNPNNGPHIIEADTMFNEINTECVDIGTSSFMLKSDLEVVGNKIVIAGLTTNNYQDEIIGTAILDSNFATLNFLDFGDNEISCTSSATNGVCIDNNSNIYITGTTGYTGFPFANPNTILVVKTDTLLNNSWEHYIGGDAYYEVFDIIQTSDGGVILSSIIYNEEFNGYFYKVCIIKLDENGNLVKMDEETKDKNSNIFNLYPNPGSSELTIQKAVQTGDCELYLYNITGKLILQQSLSSQTTEINTQALENGIYIYKIISENQVIETGKWVKE